MEKDAKSLREKNPNEEIKVLNITIQYENLGAAIQRRLIHWECQ